jgi:hypothetical protein
MKCDGTWAQTKNKNQNQEAQNAMERGHKPRT